jgi:tetratricopeptide (TPR) repeat protein
MMLGISLYGCGNFDESDHAFEKALWSLRFELRDESTSVSSKLHIIHSYVKTLSNMACCSFHQGNTKKCLKAFSIALGLVVELLEKGIVDQTIDTSLPVDLYQLPEFSSNSMVQMPTAFNYTLSTILCNIAFVFGKVDDFSLSSVYLNKALKIQRRIPSHSHSFILSIDIMDSLAYCLRKTDRLNAAIRLYKNILKTKRELFRSEVQYRRCMANASSFCQALQTVKTSSIEI